VVVHREVVWPSLLESELDAINALCGQSGVGGALVLRGEAGVGKSALLDAAISSTRRSEVRVLTTAGVSLQMQQPFAALAHLMRPLLDDPRFVMLDTLRTTNAAEAAIAQASAFISTAVRSA
jgi:predicted ATP-dependent serine protease